MLKGFNPMQGSVSRAPSTEWQLPACNVAARLLSSPLNCGFAEACIDARIGCQAADTNALRPCEKSGDVRDKLGNPSLQ